MIYIYEKRNVRGYQKWYSHASKSQIQKYKYRKTQIHTYTNTAYDELPKMPNMWYIFEERIVQWCQKLYSHVSSTNIQTHKYVNTQIHKYRIWKSARKTHVSNVQNLWWFYFVSRTFKSRDTCVFRRAEWKWMKEPKWKSSQILQFRARFCRNCKFLFSHILRGPGGIYWQETDSDRHLEHP